MSHKILTIRFEYCSYFHQNRTEKSDSGPNNKGATIGISTYLLGTLYIFYLFYYMSYDLMVKLIKCFSVGLEAELSYVRDGVINHYALNFVVPVPSKIDNLHFTWESLTGKPVNIKVLL